MTTELGESLGPEPSVQAQTVATANPKKALHRMVLVIILATLLAWFGYSSYQILFPSPVEPTNSDVVVSLASSPVRLAKAIELFEDGTTDDIAISWFPEFEYEEDDTSNRYQERAAVLCDLEQQEHVHCFTPDLHTTKGEALAVKDLAEENGWESILVSTSSYHVFRTTYIFEHVLPEDITVEVIPVEVNLSPIEWAYRLTYENVSYLKTLIEIAVL